MLTVACDPMVCPKWGFRPIRMSTTRLRDPRPFSELIPSFDAEHLVHLYTQQKLGPMLRQAAGACVFVDHADRLVAEGADPMYKLAFRAIIEEVRWLSNQGTVCIFGVGPGGRARIERHLPAATALFNFHLKVPDWTSAQLARLCGHVTEQIGFAPLEPAVEATIVRLLDASATASDARRSNALLARQLVSQAIQQRALRTGHTYRPFQITAADWEAAANQMLPRQQGGELRSSAEVLADLDKLVGRASVKRYLHGLQAVLKVAAARAAAGQPAPGTATPHMIFKGNPGTGKTVVAKMTAEILRDLGLLKRGQLITCTRGDLVGQFVGHTAPKTQGVIDSAMGGVLFIDEAYSLVQQPAGAMKDVFGEEALTILLDNMELHRDELVVILAGYDGHMDALLDSNPGLRSRFPNVLQFEDFTAEENRAILGEMLSDAGYTVASDPVTQAELADKVAEATARGSGNARTMRNLMDKVIRCHARRVAEADPANSEIVLVDIAEAELPFKIVVPPKPTIGFR